MELGRSTKCSIVLSATLFLLASILFFCCVMILLRFQELDSVRGPGWTDILFSFLIFDEVLEVFTLNILLSVDFPCVTFIMYGDYHMISISYSIYAIYVLRLYCLCF